MISIPFLFYANDNDGPCQFMAKQIGERRPNLGTFGIGTSVHQLTFIHLSKKNDAHTITNLLLNKFQTLKTQFHFI